MFSDVPDINRKIEFVNLMHLLGGFFLLNDMKGHMDDYIIEDFNPTNVIFYEETFYYLGREDFDKMIEEEKNEEEKRQKAEFMKIFTIPLQIFITNHLKQVKKRKAEHLLSTLSSNGNQLCPICYEETAKSGFFYCNHERCYNCVKGMIKHEILSGRAVSKCPLCREK